MANELTLNDKFIAFQDRMAIKMAHFFFGGKVKNRIFLKLAALMDNDLAQLAAIETLWDQASDDGKKPGDFVAIALQQWGFALSNGLRFFEAVDGWIPRNEVPIIRAGEDAGRLQGALRNSVLLSESMSKIRGTIIGGLIYPVLLMLVVVLYLVLFSVMLVPSMSQIMPESQWQGSAHYMGVLASFVVNDGPYVAIGFCIFLVAVFYSFPRLTGKIRIKLDKIPPWSMYRILTGAGFMLSVSALYAAGAKEPDIMRILLADAEPYYAERLEGALNYMRDGADFGTALWKAGHDFPEAETVRDLRAYAKLASFDTVLDRIARQWIEDSVTTVKAQANVMQISALFIMASVIGFIISSIFALQEQISTSVH